MAPPQCNNPNDRPVRRCAACNQPAVYGDMCAACDADPNPFGPWDDPYPDGIDRESCWQCHGAGGWHDCGEDCCPCARPELNETCPECGGKGWL